MYMKSLAITVTTIIVTRVEFTCLRIRSLVISNLCCVILLWCPVLRPSNSACDIGQGVLHRASSSIDAEPHRWQDSARHTMRSESACKYSEYNTLWIVMQIQKSLALSVPTYYAACTYLQSYTPARDTLSAKAHRQSCLHIIYIFWRRSDVPRYWWGLCRFTSVCLSERTSLCSQVLTR